MNPTSHQIPNNIVHELFGEINISKNDQSIQVVATILLDPIKEGSQTAVALDGSASMKALFGNSYVFRNDHDDAMNENYIADKKASHKVEDGVKVLEFLPSSSFEELLSKKLLVKEPNLIHPIAAEVIPYLASKIDADGGTTVVYWACGNHGDQVEILGDLTAEEAAAAAYDGPVEWGNRTCLLPPFRYFVERFADAPWGFYVFITDGIIEDMQAVKDYTVDLSRRIEAGTARPVNCVIIGVGDAVSEENLAQLDDLPEVMGLQYDIWDHKMASTMRDLRDIFAEVVDTNSIVAPTGRALDHQGNIVKVWSDGVPTKLEFKLPPDANFFVLEVEGYRIEQPLK